MFANAASTSSAPFLAVVVGLSAQPKVPSINAEGEDQDSAGLFHEQVVEVRRTVTSFVRGYVIPLLLFFFSSYSPP